MHVRFCFAMSVVFSGLRVLLNSEHNFIQKKGVCEGQYYVMVSRRYKVKGTTSTRVEELFNFTNVCLTPNS